MLRPTIFLVLAIFLQISCVQGQIHNGTELVRATLIADGSAFVPGKTIRLGVLLDLAPGWHVYWKNPGDAGISTSLEWSMPEGFTEGEIQWPIPKRIIEPGDLHVFGYKKQVLLVVPVSVPESFSAAEATVKVKASWLVCETICVPGSAEMELALPVSTASSPINTELFTEYAGKLPSPAAEGVQTTWTWKSGQWHLEVPGIGKDETADFFPFANGGSEPGHTVLLNRGDSSVLLAIPSKTPVRGLLVLGDTGKRAWEVSSPNEIPAQEPSPVAAPASALESEDSPPVSIPSASGITLWTALLYGMLGGMILNLMPCVLPVISLKIFGFIRQAGESPGRIFCHGAAFAAGIFAWFLGLACVVVALRMAGDQVTWAFQFQNPWFILFIAAVVFVFALNLFGVFEIMLPGSANSTMSNLAEKDGYSGSFFQGIFATLLATPCTAPFLGTALGFAFSQPTFVIFAMFSSVAFGMALPYLILSARPGWIRKLPKPGTWMEYLKQLMGFPLIVTLLWLLFVLGGQKGLDGVIWAASLLTCLAFSCWLYGTFCLNHAVSHRGRVIAGVLAVAVALGGSWFFGGLFARSSTPEKSLLVPGENSIAWVPFSRAALAADLEAGKPVFIDFTADWCITCKFNERTAINTPAVRKLISEKGIIPMKADWTNANPEITGELKKFGRVGVPFYIFYPEGDRKAPVVFPELITEQMILDGLSRGVK